MKREIAVIGMIACIAVGLVIGFFIPGLLAPTEGKPLLNKIKDRGYFIVGTSADYPPFENVSYPSAEIVGFDIDIAEMIADEIGVNLEMTDIGFDSLIGACRAGTIDMIAAAMTYTTDREKQLAASVTYITVRQVVVVKSDSVLTDIDELEDLIGQDVGCQGGTVMEEELVNATITPTAYDRVDLLLQDLYLGAIDAAYIDGPIFDAYQVLFDLKIIFSSDPEPLSLWCRKYEPELMHVINEVILEAFQDGTMLELWDKWFNATG
ncbi:MAG: transporter substrate-binding domain-containing protein [Candidatus Lokiarchaeota archaeon]|nr:transporter substrate-binding domain-containing protein [Candidatus Lokiarchaeota archaeon]